jgi:hypothetical protein
VAFTPVTTPRGMPLVLAFLLIGVFVWFAENIATYLGAWQYPDQGDGWRMVSLAKLSSWSLLVIVSMMAVVQLKRVKGGREGEAQDVVLDEGWTTAGRRALRWATARQSGSEPQARPGKEDDGAARGHQQLAAQLDEPVRAA